MTKNELEALGVSEEAAAQIIEDYGRNYVSKAQFNQKNDEVKKLRQELEQSAAELETAKTEPLTEMEALKKQVAEMRKQNEQEKAARQEAEQREQRAEIHRQTVEAFTAGNASNPVELAKVITSGVTANEAGEYLYTNANGEQMSIADAVNGWLGQNLWAVADTQTRGNGMGGAKVAPKISRQEFEQMTYKERAQLYSENADLYNELREQSKGD